MLAAPSGHAQLLGTLVLRALGMRRWMMMSTSDWIASGQLYYSGVMQMQVSARQWHALHLRQWRTHALME